LGLPRLLETIYGGRGPTVPESSNAILSLALGIGANTAIFQLLDAVRLRSLPLKDPQELVDIRVVDNPYGRTGSFASHNPQLTNAIWGTASRKTTSRFPEIPHPVDLGQFRGLWSAARSPGQV